MKKTKPFRIVLTDCNAAFVHCENVGKSRKKFIVSGELTSRDPDQGDLLKICKSLNEHRTKCVVIGGMAMLLHGFNRATEGIVLLVDKVRANIALLRKALSIMVSKNMELFVLQMKLCLILWEAHAALILNQPRVISNATRLMGYKCHLHLLNCCLNEKNTP